MRSILLLLLLIPIQLSADTFYVDGPGDGDGNGSDEYDTVHDALIAFGPLGTDGASDEILITFSPIHEEREWMVNGSPVTLEDISGPGGPFPPLQDDIRIAGASAVSDEGRVVVDIPPTGGFYYTYNWAAGFEIRLADEQDFVFENITLMPTYVVDDVVGNMITINPASEEGTQTASVTFRNVWCVPSLEGNVPLDPRVDPPGGTQITGDNSGIIRSGYSPPSNWSDESVVDHTFEDVVIAGHRSLAMLNLDIGRGDIVVDGGQFLNGSSSVTGAFILERNGGGDTTLAHTRVIGADSAFLGIPLNQAEFAVMTVGPSVEIQADTGLRFGPTNHSGRVDFRLLGTEEEPIISHDAGLHGIHINAPPNHTLQVEHVQVYGSGTLGMIYIANNPSGEVVISDSLFTGNIVDPLPSLDIASQIRSFILGDNPQSRIVFEDCTFHDVVQTFVGSDEINAQIALALFPAGSAEYEMRNCIFSGELDETAIHIFAEASQELTIRDSAIVMEGPYTLGGVGDAGPGNIELINCIYADPMYVQTDDPKAPGFFDVQNPAFATAGPDGGPLTGWGHYVGPLPPFEPSGMELH